MERYVCDNACLGALLDCPHYSSCPAPCLIGVPEPTNSCLVTDFACLSTTQVAVSLRFQLGGSESQRVLVVVMKRLEETRLMLAADHKGRLVYANTCVASMLGYKLAALKARDFSSLLPPPYSVMHTKFIKVTGRACA